MRIMKDEINEAFTDLSLSAGRLTPGQLEFAKSLHHYYYRYKKLSERQIKVLFDIKNSLHEFKRSEQVQLGYHQQK